LSRPDKCVLRRSASGGRTAPPDILRPRPDTERTCLVVQPTQFTPDTTKQCRRCRVWRGGVNWTIADNVFRLHIFCRRVLSCRESNSHRRSRRDTDKTVLSWRCELALTGRGTLKVTYPRSKFSQGAAGGHAAYLPRLPWPLGHRR